MICASVIYDYILFPEFVDVHSSSYYSPFQLWKVVLLFNFFYLYNSKFIIVRCFICAFQL